VDERPLSTSPYGLIGAAPGASDEELRRAYRRALREAHPDTGGDAARFLAVQTAWELIGTPEARARYDAGAGGRIGAPPTTARPSGPRRDTRPAARSFGHPGGWRRERYLAELRAWVGLGDPIADPYDPRLVRSAPLAIRRLLADALAEEATARTLSSLGVGSTIWHDLALDGGPAADPDKLDHLVLGPTGLVAIQSEDFGGAVKLVRGEVSGPEVGAERPLHALAHRAKRVGRLARVRVDAALLVLPDDALAEGMRWVGRIRGIPVGVVRQERLASILRAPLPGVPPIGGTELFEVRTRLQEAVTFR